jgi:hypothetical protein
MFLKKNQKKKKKKKKKMHNKEVLQQTYNKAVPFTGVAFADMTSLISSNFLTMDVAAVEAADLRFMRSSFDLLPVRLLGLYKHIKINSII